MLTSRAPDVVELPLNREVTISAPCPVVPAMHIARPITLQARNDGLRVQIAVADRSFHPGSLRSSEGERDVAVVFPSGEGPGSTAMELASRAWAQGGGYDIDDTLPWESWGLAGPDGSLHLVCVIFDRAANGDESELRVSLHVRLRP